MSDELLAYTSVADPDRQAAKAELILRAFMMKRARRFNFEAQWNEAALVYLPEWANTFSFGYDQMPGMKKSQYQIEAYPSICAHRFAAITNSLVTPWTMQWSRLKAGGRDAAYLMKQPGVKQWYSAASDILWEERYKSCSGFLENQLTNWLTLGVFGNQNMFVEDLRYQGETGLGYTSISPGHIYYDVNNQGKIHGFFRTFRWTASQIYDRWPLTFPPELKSALEQKSEQKYWMIQYVYPNTEYQPFAYASPAGKRWLSCYMSFHGKRIVEEGGYRTFPLPAGRYVVAPDEDNGRGPAQITLGGAKSMQAMKATYLKQTHRKGDPVLLGPDGGLVNAEFRPGDYVEGGMDMEGHRLVDVLPTGEIADIEKALAREAQMLDDGFLTSLFQLALKTEDQPQLNVRQMMEMLEQRAMLLGPTIGRQMTEYGGSLVTREVDILSYQGKLPRMPAVIREAGGEYKTEWDNPVQRMLAAGDAAVFMQAVEMAAQVANASQDTSVWDVFAFNRAIPEMSEKRGVPVRWMATKVEQLRKGQSRQQQAERAARAREMPAQAAMEKAKAITAKAMTGGNIGGTLSGMAPGGMPEIPGNPAGMPGRPGMSGRPAMR